LAFAQPTQHNRRVQIYRSCKVCRRAETSRLNGTAKVLAEADSIAFLTHDSNLSHYCQIRDCGRSVIIQSN
jgi:hypothetical protein